MKKYIGWFLRLGLALAWFSSHIQCVWTLALALKVLFDCQMENMSVGWVKKLQYQIYLKAFFDAKCITILYFHFTSLALAMKLHFALLNFKLLTTWDCRNLSNNHCRIQNLLKTKWVISAVLHCKNDLFSQYFCLVLQYKYLRYICLTSTMT